MTLAFGLLGAFQEQMEAILGRHLNAGEPQLAEFASYAHFALEVELFYHFAVHKGRMSVAQRMDLIYLFYLPFCDFFVSNDWVHRDSAPLFLRSDQDYIAGAELKAALRIVNSTVTALSDEEKKKSIHELAPHPPLYGDNLVTKLWDRHHPSWLRRRDSEEADSPPDWLAEVGQLEASVETGDAPSPEIAPTDAIMRVRAVRKKRGSWWLCQNSFAALQRMSSAKSKAADKDAWCAIGPAAEVRGGSSRRFPAISVWWKAIEQLMASQQANQSRF
jgi:hypothetical protein